MKDTVERSTAAHRGIIFRRNVGGIDRVVRVAVGAILLVIGLVGFSRNATHSWGLCLLGLFIITMAVIGFCPLYLPFGTSTARGRQSGKIGE